MKPLILTGRLMPEFVKDGLADIAINLDFFRFIWGPQPSLDQVASYLGPRRPDQQGGTHWSDWAGYWNQSENREHRDLSLAEFCQQYETVELWFDMCPDAQLKLVWLLDYFSSYPEAVARLKMRVVDLEMIGLSPNGFRKWRPPARQCHREGSRDGKCGLAGLSVADARSLLRSASPGLERSAAAQAGLMRSARRASVGLDRPGSDAKCGCWR